MVDAGNAFFKIYTRFNGAQHFVAAAKDAVKKLKFFREELIDTLIRFVLLVEEIDDNDVMLLAVPVAAANALLDALRIPGKVVIYNQRAELEVDAFGARFGRNHNAAFFSEIIHQRGTHIGRA